MPRHAGGRGHSDDLAVEQLTNRPGLLLQLGTDSSCGPTSIRVSESQPKALKHRNILRQVINVTI
jgi:hypothetical protein